MTAANPEHNDNLTRPVAPIISLAEHLRRGTFSFADLDAGIKPGKLFVVPTIIVPKPPEPPPRTDDGRWYWDGRAWIVVYSKTAIGAKANGRTAITQATTSQIAKYAFALIWRQTLNVQLHNLPVWVEARGRKTERANLYDAAERLTALAVKDTGALIGPNDDWYSARQIRQAFDLSGWSADVTTWWLEDNGWVTVNRTPGKKQRNEWTLTIPKGIAPVTPGWPLR